LSFRKLGKKNCVLDARINEIRENIDFSRKTVKLGRLKFSVQGQYHDGKTYWHLRNDRVGMPGPQELAGTSARSWLPYTGFFVQCSYREMTEA